MFDLFNKLTIFQSVFTVYIQNESHQMYCTALSHSQARINARARTHTHTHIHKTLQQKSVSDFIVCEFVFK